VWWGLRADAEGTGSGLPVVVFGGDHGDLPLDANAGEAIADALVDLRPPAVIDLSLMRKGEQQRFVMTFAERLYHRNRAPLHVVLDEADAWAPQRPVKGQERLLGAVEDLVRRGRARGLGVTLITQRPAVLHKDVLTQVQVLIALRMVAPHDREAIDTWVRVHGTREQRDELMGSLPSLPVGHAWIWSPGWLDLFQRVTIRRRETFDSSATPKLGEERRAPQQLASVDLEELRAKIAATIETVEENDPRVLKRRIAELERQLKTRVAAERTVEQVEIPVPVVPDWIGEALDRLREQAEGAESQAALTRRGLDGLEERIRNWQPPAAMEAPVRTVSPEIGAATNGWHRARQSTQGQSRVGGGLRSGERRMLQTLAQRHPGRLTVPQLGALSRLSHRGGTFAAYFARLQRDSLIDGAGDDVGISEEGFDAIGAVPPEEPQSATEVAAMWRARLPAGTVRVMDALIEAYPDGLDREELAERAGLSASGGTFGAAVGALRRYALAEGVGRQLWAGQALVDPA
jgi:hypothetical protein